MKLMQAKIDIPALLAVIAGNKIMSVNSDIPRDAQCVGYGSDAKANAIFITFKHQDFAEVDEGQPIPQAQIEFAEKMRRLP